jgi:DNA primase
VLAVSRQDREGRAVYYSDEVISEVCAANDIVDVIGQYITLKKSGSEYKGVCPFHADRSPSFYVSPQKQLYHCFGCGESGTVITFLMKYENYSFQEALKVLAKRAGITLPEANYSEEAKKKAQQREILLAINKEAATYYFKLLRSPKGKRGMEYFQSRKLSLETMNRFGLGFADGANNDCVAMLRKKGFADDDILASGVAAFDEKRGLHDKFWNRVMYPIMDTTNRVIGFGGRVMGDGKPKYLNSPETPIFDKSRNLYGLNIARKSKADYFVLCEGYMDVIAQHQAGFDMAIASLGTAFTPGQAQVIKRYTKHVLLSYDSDGPGVKAALRNIGILQDAGMTGRCVNLEPYKDPDEFIKGEGHDAFQKRLDEAEDSFFYELRQEEKKYDLSDPAQKTEFYHFIAKKLCGFTDDFARSNYMSATAQKYFIPLDLLKKEVASYDLAGVGDSRRPEREEEDEALPRMQKPESGPAAKERKLSKVERAQRKNERLLLTWLSDSPEVYPQIREYISAEDFTEGIPRQTAEKYLKLLERYYGDALSEASGDALSKPVNPGSVIASFEEQADQQEAAQMFEEHLLGISDTREREKALKDVLVAIKRQELDRLMENTADPAALKAMIQARKQLAQLQQKTFHLKS